MAPLEKKFATCTSKKGCRYAYGETPKPVRVADDSHTNEDLLVRHSASTIVHARMAWKFLREALDSDPACLTCILGTNSRSAPTKVIIDFCSPKTRMESEE